MTINNDSSSSKQLESYGIPTKKHLTISEEFELPRPRSTPPSPSYLQQSSEKQIHLSLTETEWTRKKFHDLQTYRCADLLKHTSDVNNYTSEGFEQVSCMQQRIHYSLIQRKLPTPEDLELYRLFSNLFDVSYTQALTTALQLHEKFKSAFYTDEPPSYDSSRKVVTLNYDQLSFVQNLMKLSYPGFYSLSQNPKQNRQVAHIAQVIVLGKQVNEPPNSSEAFEVREIGSRWSTAEPGVTKLNFQQNLLDGTIPSANIKSECHKAFDLLVNEFVLGNNYLEIGDFSTKNSSPTENKLEDFLTSFCQQVIKQVQHVETSHPGRTELEILILIEYLSKKYSLIPDTKEIISEAFSHIHPNEYKFLTIKNPSRHPVDIGLMQQIIYLKFIEFTLFLKSSFEEEGHKNLEKFYEQYLVREKVGEKGEHAQFQRHLIHYRFGNELKPESIEIHHQVQFPSQTSYMIKLSENFGGNVSIGKIISKIDFLSVPGEAFYIQNPISKSVSTFKQCLWNWRTPERLLEYTLKKICPAYYSKSIKKQLHTFINKLKELEKVREGDQLNLSEDFDISITAPATKGWAETFSSYIWYSSDTESEDGSLSEESDELLRDRLKQMIHEGMCVYDEYTRRQRILIEEDTTHTLMISYQLANLLEGSIKGINQYISNQISNGQVNAKATFIPLINWINTEILSELPSSSSHIDGYHQSRGIMTNLKNGVLESNNGHDIEWKVIRYQSILRQLRFGIKNILAEEFQCKKDENPIEHFLSQSFVHPGLQQLQELVDDLYNNVDLSITNPERFTQYYLKCLRKAYSEKFILKLRTCSDIFDNNVNGRGLRSVRKIAFFLYTSIDLERECLALNQKFYDLGKQLVERDPSIMLSESKTESYLLERIDTLHYFFHEVGSNHKTPEISKWLKSLKDHWNYGFDPNREGNLPHKQGGVFITKKGCQKTAKSIACGSTTVEGWISYAQNNQEFHKCMEEYRQNDMRHVFVINQDLREGSWIKRLKGGVETDRINAILGIAKGLEDTFFPIVLSKNSAFFRQEGQYEEMSRAVDFKKELIKQHFKIPPSLSGNFIPPHVMKKLPGLEEQAKIWVEFVHSIMFCGRPDLSAEERQIFYDIFQDIIVLYLIVNLDADSYNISCRDAIDRAADSNSRLWVHLGLVHDMEKEPLFRQRYEAYLLSRAIMTRKRRTILERVDRNKQAVTFYESHKDALKDLHKAIFKSVSIKPINP